MQSKVKDQCRVKKRFNNQIVLFLKKNGNRWTPRRKTFVVDRGTCVRLLGSFNITSTLRKFCKTGTLMQAAKRNFSMNLALTCSECSVETSIEEVKPVVT